MGCGLLSGGDDTQYLDRELRQCRVDLAAARELLEPLSEDLAAERFRRQTLERRTDALLEELDRWLVAHGPDSGRRQRLLRLLPRRRRAHAEEARQAARLRESPLFSSSWYLTHYPEVLGTGLSPAVHYLRFGAARGFNPSADFNTRAYLRQHPQVAKSGRNPLLHSLESDPARGRQHDPR